MAKPLSIEDWTVVSVGQTQTIGSKGFQKRELVITDSGDKYPQFRMIEATQDKCADLDNIRKGDKVTVDFWVSGRQWTNAEGVVKYFNSDKLASVKKTSHNWDDSNQVRNIRPAVLLILVIAYVIGWFYGLETGDTSDLLVWVLSGYFGARSVDKLGIKLNK